MTDIKQKLKRALAEFFPSEASRPRSAMTLYGDLYHGRSEAVSQVILEAMDLAQKSGKVKSCPNNGGHGHSNLRFWEKFIKGGMASLRDHEINHLSRVMNLHLAQSFHMWINDPDGVARATHPELDTYVAAVFAEVKSVDKIDVSHLDKVAEVLARELEHPVSRPAERISGKDASKIDNRPMDVRWNGWEPVLYENEADFSGVKRSELPVMAPPARHLVIETNGKLVIFGRKCFGGILAEAIRKMEDIIAEENYVSIASHKGANFCALRLHAACGMLDIHLHERFPKLVREGEIIRGNSLGEDELPQTCEEMPHEGPEMPIMGCLDDAMALVEAMGMDRRAALEEIACYIVDVPPGPLHVYGPDGWRSDAFSEEARPRGLSEIEGGEECFLISPSPIVFDGGCLDVEMPERKPLPAGPALDL